MAAIRPFRGLRFTSSAGSLQALVAPPYDVLSPSEREDLAVRNEHNIVHLTLPEQHPDDRSKYIKYARSAALLADWRRTGTLAAEPVPALYRYTQSFHLPHISDAFTRTSFIALIKVEPYEKGVVLPHEQTFPKHKEDRMRILEATRAHLECIFGLYEDPAGEVLSALKKAPVGSEVDVLSDDGTTQKLEPITDQDSVDKLTHLLADKKVWIADGHHRYETAVAFREKLGPKDDLIPEDFMMMALSSMSDPGLVLLPTHRIVHKMPFSTAEAKTALAQVFDLHNTHSSRLPDAIEKAQAEGKRAFGIAFEGGDGIVAIPKDEAALLALDDSNGSDALKGLDVSVLHRVIFEKILGVQGLDSISYTRDAAEAYRAADEGAAASFLMNPPTVDDMKEIALGGEKMPQKSTYYFPKILSGLVLWSLNDF